MKKELSIRQKSKVHSALFLGGAAVIIIGCWLSKPLEPHFLVWVGLVPFLGSVVYRLTAIRCPHCGSNMAGCRFLPKCCPDCGKELDSQNERG